MSLTAQQIAAAEANQRAIARNPAGAVRLVAGPGTGKSRTIEERVFWLLGRGIAAENIFVVSFTRAASRDLAYRIKRLCQDRGRQDADRVSVSTLHSLALRILRAGGRLAAFAVGPFILDDWELENIFDTEFANASGLSRGRCEEVRREHEAFWSTGQWGPPNYIPPDPPISQGERNEFQGFHLPRSRTYSCVLPGELVRQCVEAINGGLLDPVRLLRIEELIVDEYQDLNPCDIQLVDELADRGVTTFVAGDDDQSVYSFRFASPSGIQSFRQRHPAAVPAELMDCFRCSVDIVAAANTLIQAYPIPNRIPKRLSSLHEDAVPPESGVVHRWSFERDIQEAQAVADSIQSLLQGGVPPREILILVSNSRLQVPLLSQQLQAREIEHETPRQQSFVNEEVGRFALATLRIVCNTDDFIAHRTVLGILLGVGAGTCNTIADSALAANINYRDIFYHPLPAGVFRGRALTALQRARAICAQVSQWRPDETLQARGAELFALLAARYGQDADIWLTFTQELPQGTTLEELRNYVWAENDEQRARILEGVYIRLHIDVPERGFLPSKLRIMTMHGVKGLNATTVFIPGLEESIFPGDFRRPYAGLVFEAARLLYVSITRARAACVLSFAHQRIVYGRVHDQVASQFLAHLGGVFQIREVGLSAEEVEQIVRSRANLLPPP